MYTVREKIKALRALKGDAANAAADLALLEKVAPKNDSIPKYRRSPGRHQEEILYDLLDYCTKEEITANRPAVKQSVATATEAKGTTVKNAGGKSSSKKAAKKK